MTNSIAAEPPAYGSCLTPASTSISISPSVHSSPPTYSPEPNAGEEIVAFTPRASNDSNGSPNGTFRRQWPQAILILKGQEEDTRLPTYGRNGRINGEIGIKNIDKVVRVTVKLSGQMNLSVADTGSTSSTIVLETKVLWKHMPDENPRASAVDPRCPSILPFYIPFPQVYQDEADGKFWRLPPSFEATFLGIPALFVRCMYTLSVTITRTRSYRFASWTTNKTYVTMLNFRPRTRPSRPIVLLGSVFASIKPVPEDWLQLMANMHVRPKSGLKHIECHLFVPSIQAFSLTESIPFHLQLCSSLQSLRQLFPPTSPQLQVLDPKRAKTFDTTIKEHSARVYIARQVLVEVHGRRRFRTFTIGIGKMWSVPPVAHNGSSPHTWKEHDAVPGETDAEGSDICLDWQGEVKCWLDVASGGFSVGSLAVKDFLVLSLMPLNPRSSPLIPLQLSHPIRLVTDPWVDADALHPGDI